MDHRLDAFLAGLPKAELHVHIEGTLTPAQKWSIAKRNGIKLPYESEAAIEAAQAYDAPDAPSYLRKFLAFYYEGLEVLHTVQDFRDVTFDYLRSCKDDGVHYAEISFDPQPHTERGIAFPIFMEGIVAGQREALAAFGVDSRLIMCINRDRSAESADAMLSDAKPYRDAITGLGLDSVEQDNPPVKFAAVYDKARADGYRLTAHCDVDQEDIVDHIRQCLDILKVERIDHGINVIEDPKLVEASRAGDICFTTCPTWRPMDSAPRRVDRIRIMHDRGLKVTLNTDDPGLFKSRTMGTLLPPVAAAGDFSASDMAGFMINAFDSAWISKAQRDGYIAQVRAHLAAWNVKAERGAQV